MTVHPKDGKPFDIKLAHTFNEPQVRLPLNIDAFKIRNANFPSRSHGLRLAQH